MDKVFVIDDVISKAYQDHIEDVVLSNPNFPWYYNPSLTNPYDAKNKSANDSYGWFHTFTDNNPLFNLLVPLALESCGKLNLYCEEIFNARAFMLFPRDNNLSKENVWHIDMENPHLVCLYYVNDSTGVTKISTKKYQVGMEISLLGDLPTVAEVDPKKGRVVIFDGSLYHQASNPDSDRRAVLNFNVLTKDHK
jgi:hypothetical protein